MELNKDEKVVYNKSKLYVTNQRIIYDDYYTLISDITRVIRDNRRLKIYNNKRKKIAEFEFESNIESAKVKKHICKQKIIRMYAHITDPKEREDAMINDIYRITELLDALS